MKILVHTLFVFLFLIGNAVSQPKSTVPEWAKSAVWYQIFPERFYNGDTSNDPTKDDMTGSWPHDPIGDWNISPWQSDWYELQPWERKNGKSFYDNTQLRRYGGDIQGIIEKLDYLSELGITALYLNPVFESPSLHKYDATMYHHIDNNFGPNPDHDRRIWQSEDFSNPKTWKWTAADSLFLVLIKESHKRDIKIIIDGVFNHAGLTFWAFHDVQKKGSASPFVDWFVVKKFDDPATAHNEFDYEGWYGVRELPELREDESGYVSTTLKEHIRAVMKRWMDPNSDGNPDDGIDGWRLDVANMVSLNFWKEFRLWTREINPESYLVGEVWWEDWSTNTMCDPTDWINDGTVFDAVMNYRLTVPLLNYFTDRKNKISSTEFAKKVEALTRQFPHDVTQVQMNTLDSHDTDRLPSIIVNPDRWFDHAASAKDNVQYDIRKPNAEEIKIQKMILLCQFTMVGAPTIYYGDEAGMWGGDDPDERKPMVWEEMSYDPESAHPFGKTRPVDKVLFDKDLFDYYRKLISIRQSNPELVVGSLTFIHTNDADETLVYERSLSGEKIFVGINNSIVPRSINLPLENTHAGFADLLANRQIRSTTGKKNLSIVLPPKSGGIYVPVLR